LVLGCSHYPYLIPQIEKMIPQNIKIIDSGEAVARQTFNVLREKVGLGSGNAGHAVFYCNSNPKVLSDILKNRYDIIQEDF
jgi:glutamate racemase